MSLAFLDPSARPGAGRHVPVARSPMEPRALAAGARLDGRDGWSVAASFAGTERERDLARRTVGFADVSHLRKVELQASAGDLPRIVAQASGGAALQRGSAVRAKGAWWCRVTPERALVLGGDVRDELEEAAAGAPGFTSVVEVTTALAALTIVGPSARDLFARFCALDLRPRVAPVRAFRPGSVARTPGYVLREDDDRFLMLVGWAFGEYAWEVVADAAGRLGGGPIGVDALDALPTTSEEAAAHA